MIEISSGLSVDDLVCGTLYLNNYFNKIYDSLLKETNEEETKDVLIAY
ncbi:hypothetical protein [Labilibaculum antarcticum]|nr:hypothetical protein [Labilibaculum antarcticum]